MSTATSKIEWTDATWNPVRGCALVSPGCTNCYAMKQAHRFSAEGQPYAGLTKLRAKVGPVWTGRARFVPEQLPEPLRWRTPKRVFVNSMSDLFHDDVTNEQIAAVFGVMAACPQHTFQILTKRPLAASRWFEWARSQPNFIQEADGSRFGRQRPAGAMHPSELCEQNALRGLARCRTNVHGGFGNQYQNAWPLPNVWLGVSVENQKCADERIPILVRTPAAIRFVSAEPLIEGVDLSYYLEEQGYESNGPAGWVGTGRGLDWVIVGGESGPGARPFCLSWALNIVADCEEASVPVFVKQLGARPYVVREDAVDDINVFCDSDLEHWLDLSDPKGGDSTEWPRYLRKREFPKECR